MTLGAARDNTEGSPGAPSLILVYPGFWRFRWTVRPGIREITVRVKQPANATPYPTLVLKTNPDVGLNADVTATSPGGAGWVTIPSTGFTATARGVVWVELWNNVAQNDTPCYFDHVVVR